jgi:hypothetical protein
MSIAWPKHEPELDISQGVKVEILVIERIYSPLLWLPAVKGRMRAGKTSFSVFHFTRPNKLKLELQPGCRR